MTAAPDLARDPDTRPFGGALTEMRHIIMRFGGIMTFKDILRDMRAVALKGERQ